MLRMRLYQLPYIVRQEDFSFMVNQLVSGIPRSRATVKYIAAPSGSGKSTCVLPVFLECWNTELAFSHYLYMPFANNCGRMFKALLGDEPSRNAMVVRMQGAAFIYQCLKTLLNNPDKMEFTCLIRVNPNPLSIKATSIKIGNYLRKYLGEGYKCLIHLDEHKKMCCPRAGFEQYGAMFSQGAMEALAVALGAVDVVATYLELPPLPPRGPSTVSRSPWVLPFMDISRVVETVPELNMDYDLDGLSADQKRIYATLMFRLVYKIITELDIMSVIHCRNTSEVAETFLTDFQQAGQLCLQESLVRRCRLSASSFPLDFSQNKLAPQLLLGIEEELALLDGHVPDIVLIKGNIISSSLQTLLNIGADECPIYSSGKELFYSVLCSKSTTDYLANTPLEAAYVWTISIRSSFYGVLQFHYSGPSFAIRCTRLISGRLFPGDDNTMYNVQSVEEGTIYYVKEGKKQVTHPLADIYFRTRKELVVIDVSEGGKDEAKTNRKKLVNWIKAEQKNIPNLELHGVVLAPLDNSTKSAYDYDNRVTVVRGDDARMILGGLDQVFWWMVAASV